MVCPDHEIHVGFSRRYWVLKPTFGAHGRGIHIVRSVAGLSPRQLEKGMLAQEYVANPMLTLDGRKFHLRIYAVVTSAQPPRVLVFRDGMMMVSNRILEQPPSAGISFCSDLILQESHSRPNMCGMKWFQMTRLMMASWNDTIETCVHGMCMVLR